MAPMHLPQFASFITAAPRSGPNSGTEFSMFQVSLDYWNRSLKHSIDSWYIQKSTPVIVPSILEHLRIVASKCPALTKDIDN